MKNTLGDLNNHLFAQLEKLGDDDLTGEELESELKRTDAICDISEQIIKNGELQYKAMKHMDEYGYERQTAILSGRLKKPVRNGRGLSLFIEQHGKNTTDQFPKVRWYRS